MALIYYTSTRTASTDIVDEDELYLPEGVTIVVDGDAVDAQQNGGPSITNASVYIHGDLFATGIGIDLWGGLAGSEIVYDFTLEIGATGSATGDRFGVYMGAGTGNVLQNAGTLHGGENAIHSWGGELTIMNSGEITSVSEAAIEFDVLDSGLAKIVNTGLISSASGVAIETGTALPTQVWNSGLIAGDVSLGESGDSYTGAGDGMVLGIVHGNDGQDTLIGASGNDTLLGGGDADTIRGGEGDDVLEGGAQTDWIAAGAGEDIVRGGSWGDTIEGRAGDDTLHGEDGTDDIRGGTGHDVIFAGAGDDTAAGGLGQDDIRGGNGDDSLLGLGDNDTLLGGNGRDTIVGGRGEDLLDGGGWADELYAGKGMDTLDGGLGGDTLTGGAGADEFVLANANHSGLGGNSDRITDFDRGADLLDLSALDVTWNGSASFDGSTGFVRYYVSSGNAQVMFDMDGDQTADLRVVIEGVTTLNASDLVL